MFNDTVKLALSNIMLRASLQQQSIHDPLTLLYNRRYLDEALPRELSRIIRTNQPLCVCMIDIDHFKIFNDTHGHEAGDEVLKHIGKILNENFRGSDIACRFGGEEFIVILVNSELSAVVSRMQSLREKIKSENILFENKVLPPITISIGIAEAPTYGDTSEKIISAADHALYQAKHNGRDRIEIFTDTASSLLK